MQGENITEAVPESAEEAAEEADLSMLVDISISCKAPYAFTNFWGEPCQSFSDCCHSSCTFVAILWMLGKAFIRISTTSACPSSQAAYSGLAPSYHIHIHIYIWRQKKQYTIRISTNCNSDAKLKFTPHHTHQNYLITNTDISSFIYQKCNHRCMAFPGGIMNWGLTSLQRIQV